MDRTYFVRAQSEISQKKKSLSAVPSFRKNTTAQYATVESRRLANLCTFVSAAVGLEEN